MTVAPDHPSLGRPPRRPALVALTTLAPDVVEVRAGRRVLGFLVMDGDSFVALAGDTRAGANELARAATLGEALALLQSGWPAAPGGRADPHPLPYRS